MKVVLTTIGSLGDLHPFIAIGRSLAAMGVSVVLAVPADAVAKARAAGLEAVPILPSYTAICERLDLTQAEVAERIIAGTNFVLDEILLPTLGECVSKLDELSADADVMAGSIFAFAAGIVAEKRAIPLVPVVLQPMTLFSAWQPPSARSFTIMRHAPQTSVGRGWNKVFYGLVKAFLSHRYSAKINAVRQTYGLAPRRNVPLFEHGATAAETLCCWSSALGGLPPDAPDHVHQVGFPFFDSEDGTDAGLAPELAAFLANGAPPVVFSLGSVVVEAAGDFYADAARACHLSGKRGVMLIGGSEPSRVEGDCLYLNYAAHSQLLPRAAALVHHGGIGTTGQALRAGCPQIVVPHFGDQFDNAARVARHRLGLVIDRRELSGASVASAIETVLADQAMTAVSRQAASQIGGEDGAIAAARRIVAVAGRQVSQILR